MIAQAQATVQSAEADLTRTQQDFKRYSALMTTDFASRDATSRLGRRPEGRGRGRQKPGGARRRAEPARRVQSQRQEEAAKLQQARANLKLAQNDLDNTVIRAPISGVAGDRAGQVGQYVEPGTELLSGAAAARLCHRQFQGDATDADAARAARRGLGRCLPGPSASRPDRRLRPGERRPISRCPPTTRRQFYQDRAARAVADRMPREGPLARLLALACRSP